MTEGRTRPVVHPIAREESPTDAVVLAVSEATGRPPVPGGAGSADALDDLAGVVDPDALEALFRARFDGRLVFEWAGCTVTIEGGTYVFVDPPD